LVNWLQDIFPEIATALKIPALDGPLAKALIWLRNRSLRYAKANVVISEGMANAVQNQGIPPHTIHVQHNWANSKLLKPITHTANPLQPNYRQKDSFIVGYSGNMGRAHDFSTIVNAAKRLLNKPEIIFEFVGNGPQHSWVLEQVKKHNLTNIYFRDPQPLQKLAESLSVADVHLVSLLPQVEGLCLPSKIYGIFAVGRPILFIGNKNGEVANIIDKQNCGLAVQIGDDKKLAEKITELWKDSDKCKNFGDNGRKLLEKSYDRHLALQGWRKILFNLLK
jgi:colanic acid biosynthesis glycosyl transferase WcaI